MSVEKPNGKDKDMAAANRESLDYYHKNMAPIENPSSEDFRKRMGLPEGVSPEEQEACAATFSGGIITQLTPEESEARRKKIAALNELPEDAKWTDIIKAKAEFGRKQTAANLGLNEDATWTEIAETDKQKVDAAGGKITNSEVIAVASNIGILAGESHWKKVLSKLQSLGIKIN